MGETDRQAGAVSAEHIAALVVIAGVIAALWSIGLPERTAEVGEAAVECLFGGTEDCVPVAAGASADDTAPDQGDTPAGDRIDDPDQADDRDRTQTPDPPSPGPRRGPEVHVPLEHWPVPPHRGPTVPIENWPVSDPNRPVPDADREVACVPAEYSSCYGDYTNYQRMWRYKVGDCYGHLVYEQVNPGYETQGSTTGVTGVHGGAFHAFVMGDERNPSGCVGEVRAQGTSHVGYVGDVGWTDYAEGHAEHGQDLHLMMVRVTQPDGSQRVLVVTLDDGYDTVDDNQVIHRYP